MNTMRKMPATLAKLRDRALKSSSLTAIFAASAVLGLTMSAAAPAAANFPDGAHQVTHQGAHHAVSTPQTYRVDLNKTQILRLPTKAGAIVVGNPQIADVTVHSPEMLFVIGRGFGETNLVVLDERGEVLVDAAIQVTSVTPSHSVRLFNAKERETYSCAPYCQPSPVLGDVGSFIGENSGQAAAPGGTGPVFDNAPVIGQEFGPPTTGGAPGGATGGLQGGPAVSQSGPPIPTGNRPAFN